MSDGAVPPRRPGYATLPGPRPRSLARQSEETVPAHHVGRAGVGTRTSLSSSSNDGARGAKCPRCQCRVGIPWGRPVKMVQTVARQAEPWLQLEGESPGERQALEGAAAGAHTIGRGLAAGATSYRWSRGLASSAGSSEGHSLGPSCGTAERHRSRQ